MSFICDRNSFFFVRICPNSLLGLDRLFVYPFLYFITFGFIPRLFCAVLPLIPKLSPKLRTQFTLIQDHAVELKQFYAVLKDIIKHDKNLSYEQVTQIEFECEENYIIFYEE